MGRREVNDPGIGLELGNRSCAGVPIERKDVVTGTDGACVTMGT